MLAATCNMIRPRCPNHFTVVCAPIAWARRFLWETALESLPTLKLRADVCGGGTAFRGQSVPLQLIDEYCNQLNKIIL